MKTLRVDLEGTVCLQYLLNTACWERTRTAGIGASRDCGAPMLQPRDPLRCYPQTRDTSYLPLGDLQLARGVSVVFTP